MRKVFSPQLLERYKLSAMFILFSLYLFITPFILFSSPNSQLEKKVEYYIKSNIYFFKDKKGKWYFFNEGNKLLLIPYKLKSKKFFTLLDKKNNVIYALPLEDFGNIYFTNLREENWNFFASAIKKSK